MAKNSAKTVPKSNKIVPKIDTALSKCEISVPKSKPTKSSTCNSCRRKTPEVDAAEGSIGKDNEPYETKSSIRVGQNPSSSNSSSPLVSELSGVVNRLDRLLRSGRKLSSDLCDLHEGLGHVEDRLETLAKDSGRTRGDLRDTIILDDVIRLLSSDPERSFLAEDNIYVKMTRPKRVNGSSEQSRANFLV